MTTDQNDADALADQLALQAQNDHLDARLAEIDDPKERVDEILNQRIRGEDPDSVTDEDRARALGANWREVIALLHRAVSLTREEAERIVSEALPEWRLDNMIEAIQAAAPDGWYPLYDLALDVGEIAMEPKYNSAEIYWETRNAYLAALMATVAGDGIPERLRTDMMRAWNTR